MYDALGRVSQQSVPCAAASCTAYWSSFAYDAVNRVVQQQRPISATSATLQTTLIDYRGLTTVVTDPQGKATTHRSDIASGAAWTYDSVKKHAVLTAGDSSHTYQYDANGNASQRNGFSLTWTSHHVEERFRKGWSTRASILRIESGMGCSQVLRFH